MPSPIRITSLDDPRVAPYRDVRDADLRGRERLFMAESELVIRRLLRTPERIDSLLLSPRKHERLREAIDAAGGELPVYIADLDLISAIAGFHIHRGALAVGRRPSAGELRLERSLGHLRGRDELTLILAEGLTNVDNMGGLFRNAAAFGVDGIVLDGTCCDPLYRKAIRVSVGHALSIPYAVCDDWPTDLARLHSEWGVSIIAAEACPEARPLWEIPVARRQGVLFGSEAAGVQPSTLAACDAIAEVPMSAGVPSLNVATAAAVFLYEIRRRERTPGGRRDHPGAAEG